MSDIKSYQRLLAVQAIYEVSINKKNLNLSPKSIFLHIIENSNLQKKLSDSNLSLAEDIFNGVALNLKKIDLVLERSLKKKNKLQSFDKLLLSIFRSAIYELVFKNEISKKIIISEYLLISNRFFGDTEAILMNGVLDNLQEI